MTIYAHRVETMLTDDQYELLAQLAKQSGRSIEELVRSAIVQAYGADPTYTRRLAALEHLLTLDLPYISWGPLPPSPKHGTASREAALHSGIALLDADVCAYAAMPDSPARDACAWMMTEVAHGRLNAATDVAVVHEIIDRVGRVGKREKAHALIDCLMQIVPIHYPMHAQDALLAADLCRMQEARGLRPSGCIHVAIMQHNGLNAIVSLDPAYDNLPDVTRLDPMVLYRQSATA